MESAWVFSMGLLPRMSNISGGRRVVWISGTTQWQLSAQFKVKVCWWLIFQYEVAVITKDGAVIEPATSADTNWDIAPLVKYVQTSSFSSSLMA